MPVAVLLELDGVLVDTRTARATAVAEAFAAEGMTWSVSGAEDTSEPFDDIIRAVARSRVDVRTPVLDDTALAIVALRTERAYRAQLAAGVTLADGAVDLVQALGAERRVGVVTAWRRADAERVLALAGLESSVRFITAADDGPVFASAMGRFAHAVARVRRGTTPADSVVALVASAAGATAARAAGARVIRVDLSRPHRLPLPTFVLSALMSDSSETAVIPISAARTRGHGAPRAGASTPHPPDVAAQYAALRTGALLVDHGVRDLWTFRGAKAAETVTGLVTNDVSGLAAGLGCYAAALTPKGRITADVRIFAFDAGTGTDWLDGVTLVVDVPERAAEGWGALIRKFVNPRSAPYRRENERLHAFGIYGARARDAVAEAFGAPPAALAALPDYAHATIIFEGAPLVVARVPTLGVDGFLFISPIAHHEAAWERVRAAVPGVVVGGEEAYTIARVEAGYPEWGLDIDETTIPQEANFDDLHAISYTKGCYTGQEVVARIHFRGHVNRHLRGIAYPPDGPAVPHGAELADSSGKVVGDVRSSVISPRLGGVAIGMIRREVELGATLHARWDGDERGVTVATLPFAGSKPE